MRDSDVHCRIHTTHSKSEMHFFRMYRAYFQCLLDNEIAVNLSFDPANVSGDGMCKVVTDFDSAQFMGLVRALHGLPGITASVNDILAYLIDGCVQHMTKMAIKVSWECVKGLPKQDQEVEALRIRKSLRDSSRSFEAGAWVDAWNSLAQKYSQVQGKRDWWCSDVVVGLIARAHQRQQPLWHDPNSTNAEEGMHRTWV
jgi:hypothetical protein